MNWVGGSRTRFMMRNDMKKQKEFFEKKKMQRKMKRLGIPLSPSPNSSGGGSVDLVTLFIVNQIAAKEEKTEQPKIRQLGDTKKESKSMKDKPLELPMSPCSPSLLNLVESQPHYSLQGARKRKHCIPEGLKCRQLSPVMESNLSDNSASDYQQHHRADTRSPFSSSSSSGPFPLQQRGQTQPHFSPQSWDSLASEKTQFRPYSLPRGMREDSPWAAGPISHQHQQLQLQTPSVPRILCGSAEPDSTESRSHAMDLVGFYLDHSESKDQTPGRSRNQSETEEQNEEELFRGFSKFGSEAAHFGKGTTKIYLKQESPNTLARPQDANETASGGFEPDSRTQQLFSCTNVSSSCLRDGQGSVESSPSYSPRGGHFSDKSDEEGSSSSSHTAQPLSEETLVPSQASQWTPPGGRSQTSLCEGKFSGSCSCDPRAVGTPGYSERLSTCPGKNYRPRGEGSHDRSVPLHPPSELQPPGEHRYKMASDRTRDTGTQTCNWPKADASTQCSPEPECVIHNRPDPECYTARKESKPFLPAAGSVIPTPANRWHACLRYDAVRQQGHEVPSDGLRQQQEEEHTPWGRLRESGAGQLSINPVNERVTNTESRVCIQRATTPTLDDLLIATATDESNGILCLRHLLGRQKSQGGGELGRKVDPAERLEEAALQPGPPTTSRPASAKSSTISLIPTTTMPSSSTGSTTTSMNTTTTPTDTTVTVPPSPEAETAMAVVMVLACARVIFQKFLLR